MPAIRPPEHFTFEKAHIEKSELNDAKNKMNRKFVQDVSRAYPEEERKITVNEVVKVGETALIVADKTREYALKACAAKFDSPKVAPSQQDVCVIL